MDNVHGSAKEWFLGCGQDAGITQPRDHSLADLCTYPYLSYRCLRAMNPGTNDVMKKRKNSSSIMPCSSHSSPPREERTRTIYNLVILVQKYCRIAPSAWDVQFLGRALSCRLLAMEYPCDVFPLFSSSQ